MLVGLKVCKDGRCCCLWKREEKRMERRKICSLPFKKNQRYLVVAMIDDCMLRAAGSREMGLKWGLVNGIPP